MKLLAINGSPRRKRNTATILQSMVDGAMEAGAEATLVHLAGLHFRGCASCFGCKLLSGPSYGRCALKDDLTPVLDMAHEADVLVLGSPFYFSAESSLLRALEERLWFQYSRYDTENVTLSPAKKACALVYTMNIPEEAMSRYLLKGAVSSFNKAVMERIFSCPCELFFCHDTLQFDDYSRYDNRIFDPAHKLERHKTVFPKDMERAKALGRMLVS